MEKGYVHVYTGNGKGKTTSAIGLMVRAAGAGLKVYFGQFMKGGNYSEIKMLKERFPEIHVEQFGGGCVIGRNVAENDKYHAGEGLKKVKEIISSGNYDLVVLDEINVAIFLEIINKDDVIGIIKNKPHNLELVLTGRYADREVIALADLASEITQVKHYYNDGVTAREGIEM